MSRPTCEHHSCNHGQPKTGYILRRNQYGHYEHPETKFLFDKETKEVFGKQSDTEEVLPLSVEDIEQCKTMNFRVKISSTDRGGGSSVIEENKESEERESDTEDTEEDEDIAAKEPSLPLLPLLPSSSSASSSDVNIIQLAKAVELTLIRHVFFLTTFSKRFDKLIKNRDGVILKRLRISRLHNKNYYASVSCFNNSPFFVYDDENEEEEDNQFRDDEEADEEFFERHPRHKGSYSMDDKDLVTLLKRVFEFFRENIKMCQSCCDIHDHTTSVCNNCLVAKAFRANDEEVKECAICLEKAEVYCTLPCNHSFHTKCIVQLKHQCCPLCRAHFSLPLERIE